MTKSDPNRVLRQLPLVAGGLAGTLLMVNRLLTEQITDSQARSDALGVIISALLILTGLLWQQVQARSGPKLYNSAVKQGKDFVKASAAEKVPTNNNAEATFTN
jgi:Protein of unknown function (DUF2930).